MYALLFTVKQVMLSNPRQMKKRHSLENRYYSQQLYLLKANTSIYFMLNLYF